jgi:D-alanyl-lipoteichoic acid acyltransferase DltB (MBOAT superfamily)
MAFIPVYILILFVTIIIDYIAGILIENSQGRKRQALLTLSIISNVGILVVFKYYNFFANNLNYFLHDVPLLNIILPIGLSFHTFQAMSYTIEVYRGHQKAERHFGIYALYVMFFPQLVAGPIERPQNVLHQFHEKKKFDLDNLVSGLKLILWGIFKKVVIADRIALATDYVFDHPHDQTSAALIVGAIFFAFQIYCDFSGYSDIALGTARVLGFRLMKNFDAPYQSASVSEFWRRWHISLSTWFRDYLYISLGGNRVSIPRWYFNLFFVFLVSGFWHGANWTFVVWGCLHGLYLVAGILFGKLGKRLNLRVSTGDLPWASRLCATIFTFILVCFAWIFFRAANISDAWYMIKRILRMDSLSLGKADLHGLPSTYLGLPLWNFWFIVGLIGLLISADFLISGKHITKLLHYRGVGYLVYFLMIFAVIFLGIYKSNRFIYFQF